MHKDEFHDKLRYTERERLLDRCIPLWRYDNMDADTYWKANQCEEKDDGIDMHTIQVHFSPKSDEELERIHKLHRRSFGGLRDK